MATEAIPEQPAFIPELPEFIPKSAPVPEPPESASVVPSPRNEFLQCVMSALRDCILYDTCDAFLKISQNKVFYILKQPSYWERP